MRRNVTMPKIAVVLSGCGVYDGAEIHESVVTLLALDRAGVEVICAAPNIDQMHVIDHATGAPAEGQARNVAVEASRIARGPVADLADLDVSAFDALIFPGGFGAAKNLSDYAVKGPQMIVQADVARVIADAHAAGKWLGFWCIAPVIPARLIPGVKVTIGGDPTTAAHIVALGAEHVETAVEDHVVDEANRVITTAAYMLGPGIKEIAAGIEAATAALLQRL
jgi:enhancing lycopene biosynthesis protein 2